MSGINKRCFIEKQPQQRYRFRSDGAHGTLNDTDGISSPQFVREVTGNAADYMTTTKLELWCHLAASNDLQDGLKLSPHTLEKKTNKRKQTEFIPNLYPIRMSAEPIVSEDTLRYEFNLQNYRIALATFNHDDPKNSRRSLNLIGKYEKYAQLGGPFRLQSIDDRCGEESVEGTLNRAYLLFVVVEKHLTEGVTYETKFSQEILDLSDIHINTVHPTTVPLSGSDEGNGTKILLLMREIKMDYQLHIREINPLTQETCWTRTVNVCDRMPKNKALTYILPEFDCGNHANERRAQIPCKIYLQNGQSKSNEIDICYEDHTVAIEEWLNGQAPEGQLNIQQRMIGAQFIKNNHEDKVENLDENCIQYRTQDCPHNVDRKTENGFKEFPTESSEAARKKNNVVMALSDLDIGLKSSLRIASDLTDIIEFIKKTNEAYIKKQRSVNTLFHDALMMNSFCDVELILFGIDEDATLAGVHNYVGSLCNLYGETLLHLACKQGVNNIDSLVDMCPQAAAAQDKHGETPMHIALKCPNSAAIVKKIIGNKNIRYNEQLLTHWMNAYNNAGYTVLHCAIQENSLLVVELLLQHSKEHKMDACAIRSLGMGQSLMHFAVGMAQKKASNQMIETIKKYYPDAAVCVNYSEYDAYGVYKGPTPSSSENEESDGEISNHEFDTF